MKFKYLAEHITDAEVEVLLNIIESAVELREIIRYKKSNFLEVVYREYGSAIDRKIEFLPDDVFLYENCDVLEGQLIEDGEKIYSYRQFMIARGYSEYWLNNPYG